MFFSKRNKSNPNMEKLLSICVELIDSYEKDSIHPSCRHDLMAYVKVEVDAARQEIMMWNVPTTTYITVAHKLLAHGSFDLLASGRYHIGSGQLNFMSCSLNLMTVYNKSMEYAVTNNLIDQKEKEEQYDYLLKRIKQVG